DNFWRSQLENKFNFEDDKNTVNIISEDAPSSDYPIFGKWINSISLLLYKLVRQEKEIEKESFSMRQFIELSTETYRKLVHKIMEILALPSQEKDKFFPKKSVY